jgi:DNA repair exonuclease SbcCD ATPase subunit
MSNSDFKYNQLATGSTSSISFGHKNSIILPDSLNSSAIQPHVERTQEGFLDVLDSSIKHFTSFSNVSSPLKQISELKAQISLVSSNIETLKGNKSKLNAKLSALHAKNLESEQENEKLEEFVASLKNHMEKLKVSIQKTENELKTIKKKNQMIEGSGFVRKDSRRNTYVKDLKDHGHSSNDEFDVFNAEENSCAVFDPFQFANPSPKVQGKSLYSRGLRK